MAAMTTLEALRDMLATIPGVASCAVGLEANIGPADYPLIRIVPSRLSPGKPYSGRTIDALIYFGAQTALSEGLETVYTDLFGLESSILDVVRSIGGRYLETITDEDRLDAYKLMTIRADILEPHNWTRCVIACSSVVETLGAAPTVLAPFTSAPLNSEALDWTPSLVNGSITRLLRGATQTRTRVTVSGHVFGAIGADVALGIYLDGALVGNRLLVTIGETQTGFSLSGVASAFGNGVLDLRATGPAGSFTFSSVTMTAEDAA